MDRGCLRERLDTINENDSETEIRRNDLGPEKEKAERMDSGCPDLGHLTVSSQESQHLIAQLSAEEERRTEGKRTGTKLTSEDVISNSVQVTVEDEGWPQDTNRADASPREGSRHENYGDQGEAGGDGGDVS